MRDAQFNGKVAFITGAARGQGRSHAVRFAEEGADIIAVDLCEQMDTVAYPMATPEDLDETVELVKKTGRRIVAEHADVRDFERLKALVAKGVTEFGRVDFVLANAGIAPFLSPTPPMEVDAYLETVEVCLNGVYFTIEAALPALLDHGDGGVIVITGSGGGTRSIISSFRTQSPGAAGYTAAKHGIVGLMHYYATALAPKNIRVNVVHPGATETPILQNDQAEQFLEAFPEHQGWLQNRLPVSTQPGDITAAMIYLCGESGRCVSGVAMAVDAAGTV
ncbi:mycofactocin-coupled SDR family oxidoreductase [Mycobacterium spongiae]|uniref:Mycofactocin-coupled SDR family oxidoreductase n=1 Tax=Mycobacterium spongiae TaxID=886343 RepID=A0A975PX19_9MYCO|nr:mycofactocin-coupled SDR family oxidoreductase [Mycobacterium spongiae]QUR67796.1 mycofactocin-coupled SDR family oxidoreductase [Mycobacterium spongiae]